jgi:hypothetical protein
MEHFVSNFNPVEIGDHLEKLMDVFCSKLKQYFLQVGTLSDNKNMDLFNFEDCNIRCFYHRLKEYYSSMGWDTVEGLAKMPGVNISRKVKLVRLAQHTFENSTTPRQSTKGTASYYPVGKEAKRMHASKINPGSLISNIYNEKIIEEMVEEDTAPKMNEDVYLNKNKIEKKDSTVKVKKRTETTVAKDNKSAVAPKVPPKKNTIIEKKANNTSSLAASSHRLDNPQMTAYDAIERRRFNQDSKMAEKSTYNGLFSKALIAKPSPSETKQIQPAPTKPSVKKLIKQTKTINKEQTKEKESAYRKDLSHSHSKKMVIEKSKSKVENEKYRPKIAKLIKVFDVAESSEDGPPRISVSSEEIDDYLEHTTANKLTSLNAKDMPLTIESADESMLLESAADIQDCKILDSSNTGMRIKELENFDDEVSGEMFDAIEIKESKPDSPCRVPVISEYVAGAVLAPIPDALSFSSDDAESLGDVPRSESDLRASLILTQLSQMNSAGLQVPEEKLMMSLKSIASSTSNYQMPVPLAGLGFSNYDFSNSMPMSSTVQTARKSSYSQISQNAENIMESPRLQAMAQTSALPSQVNFLNNVQLSNSSMTHSRTDSFAQPELAKKNSAKNKKISNNTSSVVSRDSSTKPPARMSSSSVRAKQAGIYSSRDRHPSSSNLSTLSTSITALVSYDEFSQRCDDQSSMFSVLYCSILLLNRRDNEANKEINYQFNFGMLNDDLFLVGQMAKLKAFVSIKDKKLDQALKFLNLYKEIAKIYNDEIGQATSMFGIGYCKFIQGDLIKAKIGFTDSSKRYGLLKHLFGEYAAIRNLYRILSKEKKEKEANELQERMRNINNAKTIKTCKNGIDHKKGTFIMRNRGEILSMLIEIGSHVEYRGTKDREKFKINMLLKQAAELVEEYCK